MRILFANHTSSWSGAEVALMRLANELRREHEVAVACPPGGPLGPEVKTRLLVGRCDTLLIDR